MTRLTFSIIWLSLVLCACSSGETIQFKGVALDQPGVKESVEALCKENASNTADSCVFKNRRVLMWLSYGTLSHELGWLTLSPTDALTEIEIKGSSVAMLAQVSVLSEKYGKPLKVTEKVSNGLGQKFDKEIFTWKDAVGARIQIESMHTKTDEGRLLIDSASSVKTKKSLEEAHKKAGSSNL